MAGNKIGVIIAVDGEQEFREAMKNAAEAAKQVKSELQALEGAYSGNANSLEALTKKQELLEKQQERVKTALEHAKAGYDNAQKAVEKHRTALDNSSKEVEEAQRELEQLKRTYDETSDEVKQQERKLSELTRAQEENQRNLASAEKCTQSWAKKVSSSSKDVQKNNKALQQNEKYLDEAKNATDQCAHSIDKYGNQVKEATEATKDWGESLKTGIAVAASDLAKSALGEVADKVKEAAKYVVDVGSSFDKAMSEVSALSGATGSTLDSLADKAKALGSTTKFSATEVAEAFKYMSLAGWDAQTSISAIDGVVQLAAASEMDLAEASDMITDYLSAFNMEASEATRVADMLAYAQANSNTSAAQLGEAYGNCAAGLNTAGQSIETVTAMLEAMSNQGRKGSEAGTALNSIMSQITQKMKNGAIQIGETTIAVQDQYGNFRDLVDIVGDVEKATDGMGSAEKSAALSAVFNRTALSGLNLVLNEGTDKIRGYRDALEKADGAAGEMARTMQDNLQGDLTTLNSNLEGLGIAAYQYVDGPLRGVVQGVTGFISGITDAITPQKTVLEQFITDVKKSNESVQTSLNEAEKVLSGYEVDAVKLETYKEALMGVAGATETTGLEKYQISQIVKELAGDIPELSAAWDEEAGKLSLTREEVEKLMDAYQNASKQEAYIKAMKAANDALIESEINVKLADEGVKRAQEELNKAREEGAEYADYHVRVSKDQTEEQGRLVDQLNAAKEAQAEANRLNEQAASDCEVVTAALSDMGAAFDENGNVIVTSAEDAADATEDLGEAVEEIDPDTLEKLGKAAEDMKDRIESSMQESVSIFEDFEAKSAESLDVIIERLEKQKKEIDGWAQNMETLASEIGKGMSQEFYDYLAQLGPEQGAALVQELVDSMAAGDGEFAEVSKAWTEAMDVSAQADKLSEATQAGKDYSDAMAQGMSDGQSEVEGSASQVAGAGVEAANAYQGEYYSVGENLGSAVGGGMASMRSYIMETARQIIRDAKNAAKAEAQIASPSKVWKNEIGKMLVEGMVEGIEAEKKKAEKAARVVADDAKRAAKKRINEHDKAVRQEASENAALTARINSHFGVSKTTTTGSGKNQKTVKKDAEKYYSEIFSAAKTYLDNYETIHDISIQQELSYWKKLQKTLKKGTQAWYDAQKQINSVNDQIKTAKSKAQSETLAADEAYVKKRTYQGKMDTETELAYWKQQIKGFKKYSDEWYTITDRIKTLEQDLADAREAAAAEEERIRSELLSGMEKEVDRKRTLENNDAAWELAYWKERIKQFAESTDEYLTVYKKIKSLEEEVAANKPDPVEEARQQRQTLTSVQNSILSKYKTYYKVSLKAEAQYWDAARKQFAEGTDERIEADQKYFDAVEAYTEQREQLEKDYLEEQKSIMDEEKANIEELTKAYTDAVDQREKAIMQSFSLFDAWDNEGYDSQTMLKNARTQIEGLKLWEQEITTLRNKNLPQELMDQLEEMGPEATANIYTLNRMTANELDEWVRIWQEKQEIAKRQAEKQSEGTAEKTVQGIGDTQIETQEKLAELKKKYESDLAEMNAGISSSLSGLIGKAKTIGEDTVSSLISGLKTKLNESLPSMEAYYSDWESKWMNGMNRLNSATSAGAGSTQTQTVAVDTGNIAGILVAILASLNDVKDGVGTGATITMDKLTAKISENLADSAYRSARGGLMINDY